MTIKSATWPDNEQEIRSVRNSVFVVEQSIPEALDFDGRDPGCWHALAFSGDKVVATGRMESDGHIGRIAVLKAHRGCGIRSAIVQFFVDMAKRKEMGLVYLNTQITAVGFYEKIGFDSMGDVFADVGIEHVRMGKIVSEQPGGQIPSKTAVSDGSSS